MTESSGKIFAQVSPTNFRLNKSLVVCKILGLNVETTPEFSIFESVDAEYKKKFPLGLVPSFENGDFRLFDSSAIMLYLASKAPDSPLHGKTPEESASILQYMFMVEGDIVPAASTIIYSVKGFTPYVKPAVQVAEDRLKRGLVALNTILIDKTYLVGERLTLADINTVCDLAVIMSLLADKKYRMDIRNVTRYFKTMINKKVFKEIFTEFKFCEEPIKPQQKPKDAKPAKAKTEAPKAQPKKKAKEVTNEDEDDEPAPAPKPKSALDLLPKSSFDLENWKRFYSNNDTKPTAMDYFWQNFDPVGYSIWKVQFKYNEENTLIFMSNNLIGGFFNRLDRARKYAFGVMLTLGVDNDNIISGYFVVRGQEIPFEISDAPDYESFSWVKVDQNDPAVREEIGDYFAWEGPSLPKPFADGKAFK
ncbi:Elongation factor 1-gamma [Smittium mucronatum]|uniref:Elongation factor 1-gamma n=1 Tax=Smittium mucronatum TaxID=133383 RepID=A0A1R0H4C5_9FUNG|nr:Elongation factor 1-gamma [Smittium mucronatum]